MDQLKATTDGRPDFRENYSAPVVYFDASAAFGTCAGAIQIELVSRILVPRPEGGVSIEMLVTGRLRCTQAAAKSFQDSIERALEMFRRRSYHPLGRARSTDRVSKGNGSRLKGRNVVRCANVLSR